MNDPRDDYGDPAPAWAAVPGPDPTGLRPCDRAHLAGWVGLFISLIFLGIGIGMVRVLPDKPTADDWLRLGPLGASVAVYGFAGICLIVRTLTDRAPAGPLVLMCNVIVVGPVVAVIGLFAFGVLPVNLATLVTAVPALRTGEVYAAVIALGMVVEVLVLWYTGHARRLARGLRAWLDPTGGQW